MDFPRCLEAIDGKHIAIECPKTAESANYNNLHSLVFMAVFDAKHGFMLVDIDGFGRGNDAGIKLNSTFGQALESNFDGFSIPQPSVTNNRLLSCLCCR